MGEAFFLIILQLGLLVFAIFFNKRIDKQRQINLPYKERDKKEGEVCFERFTDSIYSLLFFPISISILFLSPSRFLKYFGFEYIVIILFSFILWAFFAFLLEHLPQQESHWQNFSRILNPIAGAWLLTVAFYAFAKLKIMLK